jgi:hypothetical protein
VRPGEGRKGDWGGSYAVARLIERHGNAIRLPLSGSRPTARLASLGTTGLGEIQAAGGSTKSGFD